MIPYLHNAGGCLATPKTKCTDGAQSFRVYIALCNFSLSYKILII